jgi:hypothetical protein
MYSTFFHVMSLCCIVMLVYKFTLIGFFSQMCILQDGVRSTYCALWETLRQQSAKGPSHQGKHETTSMSLILTLSYDSSTFPRSKGYPTRGPQAPWNQKFTGK